MEPHEGDQPDLEVSPLDGASAGRRRRASAAPWLRSSARRFALSVACALLVLGALVGLILRTTPDPAGAIMAAFGLPTATTTASIPPGGDTFIVTDAVPWGRLTVDGRQPTLSIMPNLGQGFALTRGAHHLVYAAQYFATLRCVLSVPKSARDTCPLSTSITAPSVTFERFLDLLALPQRLIGEQYQALIAAIGAQVAHIAATTTIVPGERYYSQTGALTIARTAMTFTMGIQPLQSSQGDCPTVCPAPLGSTRTRDDWMLDVQVAPSWTVRSPTGPDFSSAIPMSGQGMGWRSTILIAVLLSASGWKVSVEEANPLYELVSLIALAAFQNFVGQTSPISSSNSGSAANAAAGGVIQAVSATQSQAPGDEAILLWRFGVLLAVNAQASRWFPSLPVANPYEQRIALAAVSATQR